MDVNSVMNTYNMSSLWNSLSSNSSSVPLVQNVDSTVEENLTKFSYFGESTNSELQDIYEQVEPTYGIPLQYDSSGNLNIPKSSSVPTEGLTPNDSNIISLLNNGESSLEQNNMNIISEYDSIENGTYKSSTTSIMSSDPYNIYGNIDSLSSNENQSVGSTLDSIV